MKLLCTLLLTLVTNYCIANTYYISPNGSDEGGNGSMGSPWKTLFKATSMVIKPGNIIHVLPGTYNETVRSELAPGVSIEGEGSNCLLRSGIAQEFKALIIAVSPEGTEGNQHISGIALDGNNRAASWAIEVRGRSNFSINNCTITDFEDTGVFWGGRNDNNTEPPKIYATGNTFHHNIVKNCAKYDGYGRGCLSIGGQQGMLIYDNDISQTGRPAGTNGWPIKGCNDGFLKGCKIYNNKLTKQAFDGIGWDFCIELFDVWGLEIYNNTIVGAIDLNRQRKDEYAFSVYIHDNIIGPASLHNKMENGVILEYDTETAIISNNKFKNIGSGVLFACRQNSMVTNTVIKNNVFDNIGIDNNNNEGFGVRFVGDITYYIENLQIDGNTFNGNSTQQPAWGMFIDGAGKISSCYVRGNTFKNFGGGFININPAWVADTLVITGNTLNGNGNGNRPSFTGGTPAQLTLKGNSKSNGVFFSKASIRQNIVRSFYYDLKRTSILEFIAVLAGILSVWFSRKENIYVYPVGLINTIIYIFLSFDQNLFGEASVNLYYTIMSIYGWMQWNKRDRRKHRIVRITASSKQEWLQHLIFFGAFFIVIFLALTFLKTNFSPGAVPWADAFASATAFTGMWLMTKKKVESWYWWIATNIASIPLYYSKHFVLTSVYYCILLVMAIAGLQEWKKRRQKRAQRTAGD
jgi:nicotinamide mononucleotide transporter